MTKNFVTETLAAIALGCGLLFGMPVSIAQAGVFELFHDEISTSCDEHSEPCRHNDIGYQTIYRHAEIHRYGIKTKPARYAWRHQRVMIAPPTIVTRRRHVWTHKLGGRRLVPLESAGHYRVVKPARYATVLRRVLVAPARNRVYRKHPTSGLVADTLIVKGGGCKRPLSSWPCH